MLKNPDKFNTEAMSKEILEFSEFLQQQLNGIQQFQEWIREQTETFIRDKENEKNKYETLCLYVRRSEYGPVLSASADIDHCELCKFKNLEQHLEPCNSCPGTLAPNEFYGGRTVAVYPVTKGVGLVVENPRSVLKDTGGIEIPDIQSEQSEDREVREPVAEPKITPPTEDQFGTISRNNEFYPGGTPSCNKCIYPTGSSKPCWGCRDRIGLDYYYSSKLGEPTQVKQDEFGIIVEAPDTDNSCRGCRYDGTTMHKACRGCGNRIGPHRHYKK